jgi:hypothetical protein
MLHQSGMGSRFWFDAMVAAAHASNVTYKSRIGTTPWMLAYGETNDVTKIRTFGCLAVSYLEPVRWSAPGKFSDRAAEGINLGLAIDLNTSGYKIYYPAERVTRITNRIQFDEGNFPMKSLTGAQLCEPFVPDEGPYQIAYDMTLLREGFKMVGIDSADHVVICNLTAYPMCQMRVPMEQHTVLLKEIADEAGRLYVQAQETVQASHACVTSKSEDSSTQENIHQRVEQDSSSPHLLPAILQGSRTT